MATDTRRAPARGSWIPWAFVLFFVVVTAGVPAARVPARAAQTGVDLSMMAVAERDHLAEQGRQALALGIRQGFLISVPAIDQCRVQILENFEILRHGDLQRSSLNAAIPRRFRLADAWRRSGRSLNAILKPKRAVHPRFRQPPPF